MAQIHSLVPKITRKITSPDQIIVHEDFDNSQTPLKNDIALIRLNEPVPIFKDDPTESMASPICLPWSESDPGRNLADKKKAKSISKSPIAKLINGSTHRYLQL